MKKFAAFMLIGAISSMNSVLAPRIASTCLFFKIICRQLLRGGGGGSDTWSVQQESFNVRLMLLLAAVLQDKRRD